MHRGSADAAFPVARSDDQPPRAAHLHVAHEAQRSVPTDVERTRFVERATFAATLDRELRRLCLAEAAARRVFGLVAHELLRRQAYGRLGFARLTDYAAERIGVSARALQSAARVASRLERLPAIATAFAAGELSWTQVRLLCEVAERADEQAWLARARAVTVERLTAIVRALQPGDDPLLDGDDGLLDGEPAMRLRIPCPARLRALWRQALEMARRVAGEPLAAWRAAEVIAAEAIAGRPAGMSVGDRVMRAWMRLMRRASRGEGCRAACAAGDAMWSASDGMDAVGTPRGEGTVLGAGPELSPLVAPAGQDPAHTDGGESLGDLAASLADVDAFGLDARLREAIHAIRTAEPRIGRHLRLLIDHSLYRGLGFRSVDTYVRERLGLSPRKVWALVKVEKTVRRAPAFAAAYEDGTLSWVRALTLLPVVDRQTAGAWIGRAHEVTVRRLADEVSWVLDRRDTAGPDVPLSPPPLDAALASPLAVDAGDVASLGGCRVMAPTMAVQIGAPSPTNPAWAKNDTARRAVMEVSDTEVGFTGPATVVALFRDAIDAFERAGEPRWLAVERLLSSVIADWEAYPRHRDPVFARDGWRCQVPACSGRRELQDHHITFRSRGGSHARSNRTAICAAHHHHGIHAGVIRASGCAPRAIRWELGVRADAPPLLSFLGDRLLRNTRPALTNER